MRNILYLFILLWLPSVLAVEVGQIAPNFTLQDTSGDKISLLDFKGKHLVLEWFNPDCVYVQRHYELETMRSLSIHYVGREVIWLAINSTHYMTTEDNIMWKDTNLLHYRLLSDFTGKIAKLYQVEKTPQLYIINPAGILVYKGAIDNDPFGYKTRPFNYVYAALEDSLAGRQVRWPKTIAYGCYVQYAD